MGVLDLPLGILFIPAGLRLWVISMPTPWQNLTIFTDNHIAIKLTSGAQSKNKHYKKVFHLPILRKRTKGSSQNTKTNNEPIFGDHDYSYDIGLQFMLCNKKPRSQ